MPPRRPAQPISKASTKRKRLDITPDSTDMHLQVQSSPKKSPIFDKALVLSIVLAKLEATKSCDWHDLAVKLSAGAGRGSKKAWSGTDLHGMYHDVGRHRVVLGAYGRLSCLA